MQKEMVTTAFGFDGYRIVRNLGMVRGVTVRSLSFGKTFKSSFQIMSGGKLSLYSDLCEKTRAEAFDLMAKHAEELGANAVIGVRYDATALQDIATEVLCYGTAVVAERV